MFIVARCMKSVLFEKIQKWILITFYIAMIENTVHMIVF